MILENEKDVIQDITEFLFLQKDSANIDTIDLYNMWTDKHGVILGKQSFVGIALSFINNAKTLDKAMLAESYNIDRDAKVFTT